eukprot:Clim_evm5s56 gene=Clim_evmTU5s56
MSESRADFIRSTAPPEFFASTPSQLECRFAIPDVYFTCMKIDHVEGVLLASGTVDGLVVLWNLVSRTLACPPLYGHVQPVTNLCWSKTLQYLASCSADGHILIWDLKQVDLALNYEVGEPLIDVILLGAGEGKDIGVVCLTAMGDLQFLTMKTDTTGSIVQKGDCSTVADMGKLLRDALFDGNGEEVTVTAVCSPEDRTLLVGLSNGIIAQARWSDDDSNWMFDDFAEALGSYYPRQLHSSSDGSKILAVCSDLVLRLYRTGELIGTISLTRKAQKYVPRAIGISGSGDFIAVSSLYATEHEISFYETTPGDISMPIYTLKGSDNEREGALTLAWHFERPMIATVGAMSGNIMVWTASVPQHWSSFAPKFKEIMANVLYREREDEFDLPGEADDLLTEEERAETIRKKQAESPEEDEELKNDIDALGDPLRESSYPVPPQPVNKYFEFH